MLWVPLRYAALLSAHVSKSFPNNGASHSVPSLLVVVTGRCEVSGASEEHTPVKDDLLHVI